LIGHRRGASEAFARLEDEDDLDADDGDEEEADDE
jgi:hypothetical protein